MISQSFTSDHLRALTFRTVWCLLALVLLLPFVPKTIMGKGLVRRVNHRSSPDAAKGRSATKPSFEKLSQRKQIAILLELIQDLQLKVEANSRAPQLEQILQQKVHELEARVEIAEERAAAAERLALESRIASNANLAEVEVKPDAVPLGGQGGLGQPQRENRPAPDINPTTAFGDIPRPTPPPGSATGPSQSIRFSGDFRLRGDATLRPALSTPPAGEAPVPHVQDVRARYRFRLNMDANINNRLSFHAQLSTGPANDPLTTDQDFTATVLRHPISISEAWIDFRPTHGIQLQAGRVQNIFADNSRFLFDDDLRFNGFNEKYVATFKPNGAHLTSLEFRAGQYIFTNPNVAVIEPGSPLADAGEVVGTIGRSSNLFHQGVLVNQVFNDKVSQQFGVDLQLYRNPDQFALASTAEGLVLLIQPGLGIALSGPLPGTGTATTTPGGAMYSAPGFQIARMTYTLNLRHSPRWPVFLNFQAARNTGTALLGRDALLGAIGVGRPLQRGDQAFLYVYSRKGANSLISQLTDNDLGTGSGVNISAHVVRYTLGLARNVFLQSLFFTQKGIRNSDPSANFFVPLNAFTPRQYRLQQQVIFTF